jgi:hypothetical protein
LSRTKGNPQPAVFVELQKQSKEKDLFTKITNENELNCLLDLWKTRKKQGEWDNCDISQLKAKNVLHLIIQILKLHYSGLETLEY